MGRFGIGARVRDDDGDTGVIVGKRKGFRSVKYEGNAGDRSWLNGETALVAKSSLTLNEASSQWVPKVGDRVRYDDGMTSGEGKIVAPSPEAYFDWSVRTDGDQRYFYKDERFDFCTRHFATKHLSPIQSAKQPAGLTIEVGKFYRTRDGRKVGPALGDTSHGYGKDFPWRVGVYTYTDDGRVGFIEDHCDLVAEWVEPDSPVIAVATPEPAATPAKFKVGDRVDLYRDGEPVECWRNMTITEVDRDGVFEYNTDVGLLCNARELKLATPEKTPSTNFIVARLTPSGAPRPNARPRVHTTLASANQEAQRLADRLGDEFAVYQRVSTKTVDAGPVPKGWRVPDFNIARAKAWLSRGAGKELDQSFDWSESKQGVSFWFQQWHEPTPLGRAILRKWIAEAEANQKVDA